MGPVVSVKVPRDSTYSGILSRVNSYFAYRTLTFYGSLVPKRFHYTFLLSSMWRKPYYPAQKICAVWALPLSLAATYGIDFSFFSYRY